jgi:hypothetical protein
MKCPIAGKLSRRRLAKYWEIFLNVPFSNMGLSWWGSAQSLRYQPGANKRNFLVYDDESQLSAGEVEY